MINAEDLEVVSEKVSEETNASLLQTTQIKGGREGEERLPLCEEEDYVEIDRISSNAKKVPKLARFRGEGRPDIWLSRCARLLTQAGVAKSRWSFRMGLALVGEPQRWYTNLKQNSEHGDKIPWPTFKQSFLTKYKVDSAQASSRRAIRALGFISVDQSIIELRLCRKAAPRGKYNEADWIGFFYEQLPSRFYDYIILLESKGINSLAEVEELVKQYDRNLNAQASPKPLYGK